MTTPGGVPNLPVGALTVETLANRLQDQSVIAMRNKAREQTPDIFDFSTGGNILSDITPFGILTNIWAEINSRIATADPIDIQGPDDLPPIFMDFIESLPFVGQFVQLLEALSGNYTGEDPTLLGIQELMGPILALVGQIAEGLGDFLKWIWDNFGPQVETLLKPIVEFLVWLWQGEAGGFEGLGAVVESVLKPIVEWLTWIWTQFGSEVDSFLKPIAQWLKWVWDEYGPAVETFLKPLFEWLNDLWIQLGATVLAALTNLIKSVKSLIALPTLQNLIEQIASALTGVVNPQGFTDLLIKIVEYFKSLFKTGSVTDFTKNLPIIGPLVSAITGLTESDGVALDFGTLGTFFRNLEKKATVSDDTLAGVAQTVLGGILSIGMLNTTQPNLLSQGDFATAATIEPAGGWSWDNTVSATSTGGSLLATATGSLQQMYSKQSISVATNDKIKVQASVLTSGFTSGSIVLSIVPWIGTTQQTTHVVTTRTSSASSFQSMTGSTIVIGGTAGAGEISIPAGVTSIQVRLAVNANAGAKVWFDDISVRKTGLLEQSWVDRLPDAWKNLWQGLVGTSGADKTWADMFDAAQYLRLFANGTNTNLGTLSGGLLSTPADYLGSLFGVKFDANNKTVADFLKLLYNALNKSTSTSPKSADDVANAAGATRDAADTATVNANGAVGTATSAESLASSAASANNLVISPDFEDSTIPRTQYWLGVTYAITYSTEQYKNGSQSLKLVAANGSSSGAGGVILSSVRTDVKKNWIPVAPGQIYYFDVMYFAGASNPNTNTISVALSFNDINGNAYSLNGVSATISTKGSWQRLTGSYTIPTSVSGYAEPINMIPALVISGPTAAGDTYYIDRAIIYR